MSLELVIKKHLSHSLRLWTLLPNLIPTQKDNKKQKCSHMLGHTTSLRHTSNNKGLFSSVSNWDNGFFHSKSSTKKNIT